MRQDGRPCRDNLRVNRMMQCADGFTGKITAGARCTAEECAGALLYWPGSIAIIFRAIRSGVQPWCADVVIRAVFLQCTPDSRFAQS